MTRLADLRRAMAKAQSAFADHPDVNLIGVGEKHKGEENKGAYALVLYVERKGHQLGPQLPKLFTTATGDFITDVIEMPKQNMVMANTQLDGADVLIDAKRGQKGTLGFVAFETGGAGRTFGITNAHVVADTGEDARGREISATLNGRRTVIGEVFRNTVLRDDGSLNDPDVALITLNNDGKAFAAAYQIEAWRYQQISGVDSLSTAPQRGARLLHQYASKAVVGLQIINSRSPFEVANLPMIAPDTGRPILFKRAFHARTAGAVRAGHSGAAVTRLRSNGRSRVLTGLVVGGRNNDLFAFSWSDVARTIKNKFGVDF